VSSADIKTTNFLLAEYGLYALYVNVKLMWDVASYHRDSSQYGTYIKTLCPLIIEATFEKTNSGAEMRLYVFLTPAIEGYELSDSRSDGFNLGEEKQL